MIKLTDLLSEIELRKTPFDMAERNAINTFLDEFSISEDVFSTEDEWDEKIEDIDPTFIKQINSKKVSKSKQDPFELILSPSRLADHEHLYLINTEADTLVDYIAGYIDITLTTMSSVAKPYQMSGAQIYLTWVNGKYRGMGLGLIMYNMLIKAYKTVFSDDILYEASKGIWSNKLASMSNGRNMIFGGQSGNVIVPLSVEDASSDYIAKKIDRFFFTISPPPELRKISSSIYGLSISKGEYAVFQPRSKMDTQKLVDLADNTDSIPNLIKSANLSRVVGIPGKYEKIIVETTNGVVVVDDLAETEVI